MPSYELIRKDTHPEYFVRSLGGASDGGSLFGEPEDEILPPILLNPIIYATWWQDWRGSGMALRNFLYNIIESNADYHEEILADLEESGLTTHSTGGGGYDRDLFSAIEDNIDLVKNNLPLNDILSKDAGYKFHITERRVQLGRSRFYALSYGWVFPTDMFVAPLGHTTTPFMNWKQDPFTNN